MAFQPRGKSGTSQPTGPQSPMAFNSLVDKISEAVRERLIQQGVPMLGTPTLGSPKSANWQNLIHQGADRVSSVGEKPFQPHELTGNETLAQKIDHTLLKPDATKEEIKRICEEARQYHFATVCVNSVYIALVAELLKGSSTKPIAVVGFPLGAAATATKAFEAREAVRVGAQEIDMVLNIGALKGRDYALVLEDIRQVVEVSKPHGVKVILETSSLTEDEKIIGCALSKAAGAAFVKTSTGFASGGATAEDIALMRRIVGPEMGVKASGGIRTYEDATKMIAAGASRVGASASVAIVTRTATDANKKPSKSGDATSNKPYKNSLY
ncbi:deoxyribose-phosphate aldolase [Bdellovibrionota bacterium FG-2]